MTFADAVLRALASALVAAAVGYALARFFTAGLRRAEKLAWSFASGLLVHAILFVVLVSILPRRNVVFPMLAVDTAIVAASFLLRRPSRSSEATHSPSSGRGRAVVVFLLGVAAVAWLVFFVTALSEPMWGTDYLAMWGLKAKTIFETGSIPRRLFHDPALAWGRRDHPLFVPVSLATLASMSGGWNDQALALFFPLCELATMLAAWGFLARRVSPLAGASAAALVSLCIPLYHSGHVGLAEIPLAFALVLASSAFFDGTGSQAAVTRLFVSSLLAAWTKPEGTLFVLLLAGLFLVRKRARLVEAWKSGGWALVAPPVLHAGLFSLLCRPEPTRDFDPSFFEPRHWSELLSRFGMVLARIFGTELLHAWIPVLAVGLFFLLTRRRLADALLAVFALQILAYFAAFSISSYDPMWKIDSCLDRLVATLLPALALVLGARVGRDDARQSVGEPGSTAVEVATSRIG